MMTKQRPTIIVVIDLHYKCITKIVCLALEAPKSYLFIYLQSKLYEQEYITKHDRDI